MQGPGGQRSLDPTHFDLTTYPLLSQNTLWPSKLLALLAKDALNPLNPERMTTEVTPVKANK